MYGVLTLFVMTSFWGLVNLLNGTITVQEEDTTYIQDPADIQSSDPTDYNNIQDQLQNDPQQNDSTD
jgi:hypothetical protein